MIRSIYYDQSEILQSIMTLCNIKSFDADISYGNGNFYKTIEAPRLKFDISPQVDGVIESCSTDLPLADNSLSSAVFDPPFLTYIKAGRSGNGKMVMANRFGGYWRYDELEDHYKATLNEAARVLSRRGILVFKCQDIIHNHRMHCTHVNVINWCADKFRLKDMFILAAKHRMPMPSKEGEKPRKQKHARIFHSYFLVFEKS